jgi:hypothetical protein
MTDLHPVAMPTVGASVEYLSGTVQRLSDSRFYAVIPGRRGCLTSYKTTQPAAAFRQAYNYLRRGAGLPKFPRLCSACGMRPTWKQSHKCGVCSNSKRYASKMPVLDTETPLPATQGTDTSAHTEIQRAPIAVKADANSQRVGSKFRDALAKCDALILARGGSVPNGYHYADWQQRRERMVRR